MIKQKNEGIINIIIKAPRFIYRKIWEHIIRLFTDSFKELYLLFFRKNNSTNKKILGVWDFNERTGTVGDTIVFLEVLNVLREEFNLNLNNKKNIDICYIDDDKHPNSNKIKYAKTYDWKKTMMSTNVVNPYIDSVFYFHSNSEFEKFYEQNKERYIRWPPLKSFMVPYDNRIIIDFYKENKYIPKLNLPVEILSKIYDFYESHVYPSMPIVLNIRNNKRIIHSHHNSNIKELKKFLENYHNDKSFKFIIICNKSEIPDELRGLDNVIFSKDHFDSIEDDLALIKTSYISIFPASGMAAFVWFTGVPAIQYGLLKDKVYPFFNKGRPIFLGYAFFMGPFNGKKFEYLSEYQRMYFRKETSKWLISKFENLVEYLKKKKINNNLENKIKDNKKYESSF